MLENVTVYIDGFNLYFGLKSKGWRKFYWLNINKLSRLLLKENQKLSKVKYFTARIEGPEEKRIRQKNYIESLETLELKLFMVNTYQIQLPVRIVAIHLLKPARKKLMLI